MLNVIFDYNVNSLQRIQNGRARIVRGTQNMIITLKYFKNYIVIRYILLTTYIYFKDMGPEYLCVNPCPLESHPRFSVIE